MSIDSQKLKQEYDVIIIGAGPAGLCCALELQNSEKTVLILEKNKDIGPKVCAGGLTRKIENFGLNLDIGDILFSSIKVSISGKQFTICNDKPFVAVIDRSKLSAIFLEKLTDKVEIKKNAEVTKIENDYIEVNGQRIKYKYLVGADGSNSLVRRFLGLKTKKFLIALQYSVPRKFKELKLFFEASLFNWGYVWIFPHSNHTSIGCGWDKRFGGSVIKKRFDTWLKNNNIDVEGLKLEGSIINFDYQGFDFGNKFLVGDAGGFASGSTGEGISFAMISGREVGKKIINPSYECQEIKHILKIKRIQELVLKNISILSKPLLNFCFKFLFSLFKFKWFTKKALKLYS